LAQYLRPIKKTLFFRNLNESEMIKATNLEKHYCTDEMDIVALQKLSIEVEKGEFVAIMGPSGCGKSTLLNILGLLDEPDEGSYFFDGFEVTHIKEHKRAGLRKENIGFLFQNFNLIDDLTVFENVELPMIYKGLPGWARAKRAEEVMDKLQIIERRKSYPQQLSGGQQQRVALARAVVNKPGLILADEPTANLDADNGDAVMDLLTTLNKEGTTIIMVTHSTHDANYSHRIIRLPLDPTAI